MKLIFYFCLVGLFSFSSKLSAQEIKLDINSSKLIPASTFDNLVFAEEAVDTVLLDFLRSDPRYSIFADLVEYTGIASRVHSEIEDLNFTPTGNTTDLYGAAAAISPEHRYQYFTCFIETNDVFTNAIPGLANAQTKHDSISWVKLYAKEWFKSAYRDCPTVLEKGLTEDWKNENNYLNRFVAYHFVNKKINRTDFTRYGIAMASGYSKYTEYAESLAPNQLIQMSAGRYGNSSDVYEKRLQLNPSADQQPTTTSFYTNYDWTRPVADGTFLADGESITKGNIIFHPIETVLTFPRVNLKKTRIRFDIASMFPEMMSNDFRDQYTDGKNVNFPSGYLTNITFNSVGTQFFYLNPKTSAAYPSWSNMQGDEMIVSGVFDITLCLPSVPAGTYEVRFGFTVAANRGCEQFYLGNSSKNMIACGIPIDLTKSAVSHGWVADTKSDEDYDNDRIFRAGGWMKGPNSWLSSNGNGAVTLRGNALSLRRIVGHIVLQEDGNIYLRVCNATLAENAQLMIDYLEICPASIYDNPEIPEPRD